MAYARNLPKASLSSGGGGGGGGGSGYSKEPPFERFFFNCSSFQKSSHKSPQIVYALTPFGKPGGRA